MNRQNDPCIGRHLTDEGDMSMNHLGHSCSNISYLVSSITLNLPRSLTCASIFIDYYHAVPRRAWSSDKLSFVDDASQANLPSLVLFSSVNFHYPST